MQKTLLVKMNILSRQNILFDISELDNADCRTNVIYIYNTFSRLSLKISINACWQWIPP